MLQTAVVPLETIIGREVSKEIVIALGAALATGATLAIVYTLKNIYDNNAVEIQAFLGKVADQGLITKQYANQILQTAKSAISSPTTKEQREALASQYRCLLSPKDAFLNTIGDDDLRDRPGIVGWQEGGNVAPEAREANPDNKNDWGISEWLEERQPGSKGGQPGHNFGKPRADKKEFVNGEKLSDILNIPPEQLSKLGQKNEQDPYGNKPNHDKVKPTREPKEPKWVRGKL
jgi:hypothetical protein